MIGPLRMTIIYALTLALLLVAGQCHGADSSLFMGLVIKDNDATVPLFLDHIDRLDYDKKAISLSVAICCGNEQTQHTVKQWAEANKNQYAHVEVTVGSTPSVVKDGYLKRCQEATYLCIIPSDVFVKPFTLRHLVAKNLPVVAPLLRPLPKANDYYRNFYLAATPSGYYQAHPDYQPIMDRTKLGTFKAACVHGVYLIKSRYAGALAFAEEGMPWDFIAFSNGARRRGIPQYICNEREFGFFLHHDGPVNDIRLDWLATTLAPNDVRGIASAHAAVDESLRRHVEGLPADQYAVFNADDTLYWLDEKYDWVKSKYLKKGLPWESHIHQLLREYTKPGTVALDIGGHIGTHTINLARLVGPEGAVHVFEPQAKLFTELLVNASLNGCDNVAAHHMALGDEEKEVEIVHPCSFNEGMAKIGSGGEKVAMKRLDSFNLSNVSIVKIDVEGHEQEVLAGGMETILDNKPVMIIEIFDDETRAAKLELIRNMGYVVRPLEGIDFLCLPEAGPASSPPR